MRRRLRALCLNVCLSVPKLVVPYIYASPLIASQPFSNHQFAGANRLPILGFVLLTIFANACAVLRTFVSLSILFPSSFPGLLPSSFPCLFPSSCPCLASTCPAFGRTARVAGPRSMQQLCEKDRTSQRGDTL